MKVLVASTCYPDDRIALSVIGSLGSNGVRVSVGAIGVRFSDAPEALIESYKDLPSESDMVFDYSRSIIREFIPGEVHNACPLFKHGSPRAVLTQKRLRMYASTGRPGLINETTDEPQLRDKAIKLLEALRWHGPAQV